MNRTVLIVDDEDNVREALTRLLRRDKCDVHTANGGPAALEQLSSFEPAVIICDERMPGMPGSRVLAEAARLRPDSYRINLTAYAELRAIQSLINEGHIHRFMLKPWDDTHVRIAVEEGFRTYRLVQDNRELQALTVRQKAALEEWNGWLEERVREQTAVLQERNQSLTELQHSLEQSLRDTVSVLAGILEAVSLNLGTHSKRVAELAALLGRRLLLPEEALRDVEFAAYLHDLGKVSTGPALVARKSPAHSRQSNELQCARAGFAILSRVRGFQNIACGVLHQVERFDGKGQPDGLAGQDIPLVSRIIRAADTYDNAAFCANNPATLSKEAGCRVLIEQRGKTLDPELVDLLHESLTSPAERVCEESEIEVTVSQLRAGMVLARDLMTSEGVLLLAKGTQVTPELINRLLAFSGVDPVMTRISVRCAAREQGSAETQSPDGQQTCRPREAEAMSATCNDGGRVQHASRPDASRQQPGKVTKAPVRQILVIDESNGERNTLSRALLPCGFTVRVASSATAALQLLRTSRFHAAIVDLAMAGMSGSGLVTRLAEQDPNLACVVLIGQATRQDILYLSRLPNVCGVLLKPWDTSRLIVMLASVSEAAKPVCCQEGA